MATKPISITIDEILAEKLERIASETHRKKSYFVKWQVPPAYMCPACTKWNTRPMAYLKALHLPCQRPALPFSGG